MQKAWGVEIMKVEYINPFFRATQDIFERMLDLKTEKKSVSVVDEMIAGQEANVIIGMTGDLRGSVLYSFSKDMTLDMVKIMSGMEMDSLDSFVTSALGEVANIISGNAATYLAEQNINCDIVPPQVIIGENKSLSMATDKALALILTTPIGEFAINLSIKEKAN